MQANRQASLIWIGTHQVDSVERPHDFHDLILQAARTHARRERDEANEETASEADEANKEAVEQYARTTESSTPLTETLRVAGSQQGGQSAKWSGTW